MTAYRMLISDGSSYLFSSDLAYRPVLDHRFRLVVRGLARGADCRAWSYLGVGAWRGNHHDDRAHLCRTGRNVSRIRRHGALRPLLAWLAGRFHRRVGQLDCDCLGDFRRGRSIGTVHVVVEVAMGEGSVPREIGRENV